MLAVLTHLQPHIPDSQEGDLDPVNRARTHRARNRARAQEARVRAPQPQVHQIIQDQHQTR